jgi:phenylacetate-CoA ligase
MHTLLLVSTHSGRLRMKTIKDFYDASPRAGQNLMVNVYGLRTIKRIRAWNKIIDNFAPSEHWEKEEQVKYVSDCLRVVLPHAIRTVPRYKTFKYLLPYINDQKRDVFPVLSEFPVIRREDVFADPASFRSLAPGTRRIVKTVTSGTTGTPFTTWMELDTFTATDALSWRRTIWSGYRKGEWIARLVGDPIVSLGHSYPDKPWRISWTDKRLYLSTFHLNAQTARLYLDILERRKPAFLMGYPSSLEILSRFALEGNRVLLWQPRMILFSSEPMYEHQRSIIRRVFRAPMRGLYGCAERIVSAAECEHGSYHLSLVDGYVEGQFGILPLAEPALITSLMNKVMPLIRFQLGDVIHPMQDTKCPCGRTLPIIDPVVTKEENWIETPSRRRVSPSALTWAFKDMQEVKHSQIIQVNKDLVEVHLDVNNGSFSRVAISLKERLDKMFFGEMKIKFVRNTAIKISSSGKTRFVINKLKKS